MSYCDKLWTIWFITYLLVINIYLSIVTIKDYLNFKYQFLDLAYGGNWDLSSIYVILCCLNVSLGLLPITIYMSVVRQGNLANDGHVLGRDPDVFHFTVNEYGKGKIVPTISKKSTYFKSPLIRLIYMELPPISYFLQVISAFCLLIPRSIIEGQRINHGVFKSNRIWHSDLDIVFDPDHQHSDFVVDQNDNYIQPVSVAYFNFGLSLILLSLQYSKVLWHISRKFTIILSFVMVLWTFHVLIEYCSISVMIKISLNPLIVSEALQIKINAFTIIFMFIGSNLVILFSFTTVFHYAVLQYADTLVHQNRKSRRQMLNSSPQMIGSNHLDIPGAFSPSVSENNYSENSVEPLFSKSHMSHIIAIICLCVSTSLKSTNIYLSIVHFYQTTSDFLTLLNLLLSCLFGIVWLIMWFALALRRTWNFKIKQDNKFVAEPIFLNGNSAPNHSGTMQLHQLQNSLLRNTKSSDMNLFKHDMRTRNVGLDGGSDDTDMSSKLSSNNYVFLQSMRNGQMGILDSNGQQSMLRNPMYLSYAVNNPGLQNSNTVYANDDSINNRSVQLDDQLGSEHSYNSNRSRNIGFENMPPILPTFDENRYRNLNPNSVAIEKLIPRYLRNPSLDYNNSVHFSMTNNDYLVPSSTSYDPSLHNHNIARYKQSIVNNQIRSTADKYSTKSSNDQMDYVSNQSNPDDDSQRRPLYNGECGIIKNSFDLRRTGKSPVMCQTVEEIVADTLMTEAQCLLPSYHNNNNSQEQNGAVFVSNDHRKQSNESSNNNNNNNNEESETLPDPMCSQV